MARKLRDPEVIAARLPRGSRPSSRRTKNWPGYARSVTSVHGAEDRGYVRPAGVSALGDPVRAGAGDRDRDRVRAGAGGAARSARGEAGSADRGADGGGPRARRAQCGAAARDRGAAQRHRGDREPRARRSGDGVSRRDRAPAGAAAGVGGTVIAMALRRAARRALKVSIGAIAGGVACAVVAAGGVDGAAVLTPRPSLAMSMIAVAIAGPVGLAVIRRVPVGAP